MDQELRKDLKGRPVVIILNHNSYDDTLKLIESIEESDAGVDIIVVDNASSREERVKLSDESGRFMLILLDENAGYAAGNNAGIRRAMELGYDAFLLANSDTRLISRNTISGCYAYMKKNGAGILAPRLVDETGKDISGLIYADRYGRTKHELTDEIRQCQSLTGAFWLIDRKVIERTGYLREFYFLYREDTDYCARAYKDGVKIVYYPMVTVIHKAGTTTKKVADYYYHRNMFIFSREIYGRGNFELAVVNLFRFMRYSLGIICKKMPGRKKGGRLKMIWRAYIDGVRDIRGKAI